MSSPAQSSSPKLRTLDIRPVIHYGEPGILLRDPLQLSEKYLIIPQPLAPALALCDGTRDAGAISAALGIRFGIRAEAHVIDQLLSALDEALFLDNERFAQTHERALEAFRKAPFRQPALAGMSYPADAGELHSLLQGYLDKVDPDSESLPFSHGRGLVSPHIDYMRGWPVYARVWKQAADAVRQADLAVILGTDHFGGEGQWTLTRQNYATPFGALPTSRPVVDALADAIGEEAAFAGELRHRSEHSIELAAVWLHFMRNGEPCETVPVLCGSFGHFIRNQADPEEDPTIGRMVEAFKEVTSGRRVIIVAAGDLAHVGPAFGSPPLDFVLRARLQESDEELMHLICAGDAQGFLKAIRNVSDRNNVCGVPPIYLALRMLGPVGGRQVAYDRCPADEQGTSAVSVCGIVFE